MRGRYDQQSEHLEAVGSKEAYVDRGDGFCAAMLLEKILITFLDDVDLDVHHSIHLRRSK
jgi:hypothetical protein